MVVVQRWFISLLIKSSLGSENYALSLYAYLQMWWKMFLLLNLTVCVCDTYVIMCTVYLQGCLKSFIIAFMIICQDGVMHREGIVKLQ